MRYSLPLPTQPSQELPSTWRLPPSINLKILSVLFAYIWELLSRATAGVHAGLHQAKRGEKSGTRLSFTRITFNPCLDGNNGGLCAAGCRAFRRSRSKTAGFAAEASQQKVGVLPNRESNLHGTPTRPSRVTAVQKAHCGSIVNGDCDNLHYEKPAYSKPSCTSLCFVQKQELMWVRSSWCCREVMKSTLANGTNISRYP